MSTNQPTALDTFTAHADGTSEVIHAATVNTLQDATLSIEKQVIGPIIINVKGYGALGDGTTDDTSAIMAAIGAIPTGGCILYFPPGTYKVTSALGNIPYGTLVLGASFTASAIKLTTDLSTFGAPFCTFKVSGSKRNSASCKNIAFLGPGDGGTGLSTSVPTVKAVGMVLEAGVNLDDVVVSGWFAGVSVISDHNSFHHLQSNKNFYNFWFGPSPVSFGNQFFDECDLTNALFASIAIDGANFMAGVAGRSTHLGFCPYAIIKTDVFTGGTTWAGSSWSGSSEILCQGLHFDDVAFEQIGNAAIADFSSGVGGVNGMQAGTISNTSQLWDAGFNGKVETVYNFIATDGAMTSGSHTLNSASGGFTTSLNGKSVTVNGAGASGANLTGTFTYVSATSGTLSGAAASTTVSGATYTITGGLFFPNATGPQPTGNNLNSNYTVLARGYDSCHFIGQNNYPPFICAPANLNFTGNSGIAVYYNLPGGSGTGLLVDGGIDPGQIGGTGKIFSDTPAAAFIGARVRDYSGGENSGSGAISNGFEGRVFYASTGMSQYDLVQLNPGGSYGVDQFFYNGWEQPFVGVAAFTVVGGNHIIVITDGEAFVRSNVAFDHPSFVVADAVVPGRVTLEPNQQSASSSQTAVAGVPNRMPRVMQTYTGAAAGGLVKGRLITAGNLATGAVFPDSVGTTASSLPTVTSGVGRTGNRNQLLATNDAPTGTPDALWLSQKDWTGTQKWLQFAMQNQPLYDAGGLVFNVKAFGAKGDGTTDDTSAIASAVTAAAALGGIVYFPQGTYITGTITLPSLVWLRGVGYEASILKLKAGTNAALITSTSFATLTGTNPTSGNMGTYQWGICDLTLDGNKAGQTGASDCIKVYGYGYTILNVRIRNAFTDGFYSEWSTDSASPGQDAMEANIINLKVHDCGTYGVNFNGPHDSIFLNTIAYQNGSYNIWVQPTANTAGTLMTNTHVWSTSGTHSMVFGASFGILANLVCEGAQSGSAQLVLQAGDITVTGARCFGVTGFFTVYGVQFGDTTHPASGCRFDGDIFECRSGSINFNNDNGNNKVEARIYLGSGSNYVVGTQSSETELHYSAGGTNFGLVTEVMGKTISAPAVNIAPLTLNALSGQTSDLQDWLLNGVNQAFMSPMGQLVLGAGAGIYNSEQLKVFQNTMPNDYGTVLVVQGNVSATTTTTRFGQSNNVTISHTTGNVPDVRAADYSVYYGGTSATSPAVTGADSFNTYFGVTGTSPSGTVQTVNLVNLGSLYDAASGTPSVTVSLQNGMAIGDMKSGGTGITVTNSNAVRIFGQTSPGYGIYCEAYSFFKNNAVGDVSLTVDTVASQTADILDIRTNGTLVANFDKSGHLIAAGFGDKSSATSPALATGGTITIVASTSTYRVTPAAAVTGVILSAGLFDGQEITVVNESAFTITFAAVGTSRVSNGVSSVIAVNTARSFKWIAATSHWNPLV